ncbi:hypothetical protein [Halalkalicoccus subterraneus]|uniref:hypothetical protein n=1 Tax=Halalkalicoccus subterraneus TaxID=2675002 RepID=UPI000EFD4A91|nr:hypothetical protein [Halalkalicoccus subterraneus]
MGFFEKIGREVEQFKQTAQESAEENASYRCRTCESRFNIYDEECPDCGANNVVPMNTEE